MMQSNLTKQMINLGGTTPSGSSSGPASCMPPYEVQRGPSGVVPPQLQGDPRYQEYLRCRQGQSSPQPARSTPGVPSFAGAQHPAELLNSQQSREFIFGVNDKLAQAPQFALMSPAEKQSRSDSLIFQAAMISVLREMGQRDRQARQQAVELSRVVMQGLT